jgi:Transposase DNA-binding/Transposase Tn5 dimerisation domain
MLGTCNLYPSPKSHPFIKESGMCSLPDDANDTHWAVTEFAEAELGDERRTQRLVELAGVLAQHPTATLPEACGDDTMLKAAYRFFANDAIEPQDILLSHIEATYGRLSKVPLVLAVQDTTAVDWTAHPATKGLGPLGPRTCQGLLVHSTLAFTPERVPVGLVAQQVWARDPDDVGKRTRRKQLPISQKESQKWLTSLEAVCQAQACCPTTRFVSVGDREADVYDLLAAERPAGVELLIRAAWDRCVSASQRYVWAAVAAQPVLEHLCLQVPRRGAQPGREATLALRFCPLTLAPPRHRKAERLPAVSLWAIQVAEIDPPAAGEPIAWLLLTTGAVHNVADARERVEWYACRWGIEVWHRILKSGCRIETRQLATGERLERCLTLYSVMAWRVLYATMLARAVPEMPCDVLLAIEEWQALYCAIHSCPTPPDRPPALGEAVRWIAQLGGFVGRRRRDPPGPETLWRGFQHLTDLTRMYRIMRSAPP